MPNTQNDLWLSIIAESDMPEDDTPLDLATARELLIAHDTSEAAHADIRARIQEIADVQTLEIKEYATKRDFPASGDTAVTIYVDISTGNLYRYNTSSRRYEALAMDTIPASPALEGRPTAPTASLGTNTTQIATTEFVQNEIAALRQQSEMNTPVYYDGRTKTKLSLLGPDGTIVTNVADGRVEQGSSDAVTGGQLFSAQQDMERMSALAARNIAANAAEIELLKQARNPFENLTDENKDTVTGLIDMIAGDGITVSTETTDERIKEFTIALQAPSGTVTETETKTVSGSAVYTAIQDAVSDINTALEDKASKDDLTTAALQNQIKIINGDHTAAMLGETDGQQTYAINVRANGLIQRNDGRLITGGTVYAETRIDENGNVVLANNTAAQNIAALDTAVNALSNRISAIPDFSGLTEDVADLQASLENLENAVSTVDTKADKDLSNLSTDGKAVIQDIVDEHSVKIINGDHTTATRGEENGQITYAINVRASGAIADRDGRVITGQTVWNEVRPHSGTYISRDATTATNLAALDTQLSADAAAVTNLAETVNGYDAAIAQASEGVAALTDRVATAETTLATKADAAAVYAKEEADALLDDKADAANVYSKTDANAKFAEQATTLAGYGITDAYTKAETDAAISAATENKADADSVYTKEEINGQFTELAEDITALSEADAALTAQVRNLAEQIPDIEYSAGSYINISDDKEISVKVLGSVTEGSSGIVTGDKIARAITNSEIRTGTVIEHVHDELTHRIERLEDNESEHTYTLIKDDETNQLMLLNESEVVSRIQLATDTDTKYSLEKVGNVIRLIPNNDPTQAIPIELDPDINTTYTLALENNQLIFTPNDDTDPTVITLPDAVSHSELVNYVQTSDLANYATQAELDEVSAANEETSTQLAALTETVAAKADASSVYTKNETDALLAEQTDTYTELATAVEEQGERLEAVEAFGARLDELEAAEDQDTTYTAGDGITISEENAISVDNRTKYRVVSDSGNESLIFNEEDGGGAKFTNAVNNTAAFVGVNDGSGNIDVQIYARDQESNVGTRISVNKNGAFYTVKDDASFEPEDEIVVKRDLAAYEERIAELEEAEDKDTVYTAGDGITISDENVISVDNKTTYRLTTANGNEALVFNDLAGGGAQFTNTEHNTEAFIGVSDGSDDIDVKIYAKDKTSDTGARISLNKNGAYYTVQDNTAFTADDEILTKRDIANYETRIADLENYVENTVIVDAYSKQEIDDALAEIPRYTAGDGIIISDQNVISVDNEMTYHIVSENGNESLLFNEEDGGGAKFINAVDNTESFVGVKDGSNDIDVQIYAKNDTTDIGARISVNPTGAYYTISDSDEFTEDDEIVVKGDLASYNDRITAVEALSDRIADLEEREDKDTLYTAGEGIVISDENIIAVDNRTAYRITSENGNESLVFNEEDGGGTRFTNMTTNTVGFMGINNGSNNVDVQIYSTNQATNLGARINVNSDGAYYKVSDSTAFTADDEIATRKDIAAANGFNVFESKDAFPATGTVDRLYIDAAENTPYRWDPDVRDYVAVSGNNNIDSLTSDDIDSLF